MKGRMMFVLLLCAVFSLAAEGSSEAVSENTAPVKVSWFTGLPGTEANLMESADEIVVYQMAQEKLNIDIEFIHPTDGNVELNLLIAAGDYPDLIDSNWGGYSGGIQKAYDDGVINSLNQYLDSGKTPHYLKLVNSLPRFRRDITNDSGDILAFRRYEPGAIERPYKGYIIRRDWLDSLGLNKPATIDEFRQTLTAFKEAGFGKTAPFIGNNWGMNFTQLSSAWGILADFPFQFDSKTGKVIYGKMTNEYKDFLITMLEWLDDGLIDAESLVGDEAALKAGFINGDAGVIFHFISRLVRFGDPGMELNPEFKMETLEYPIGPAGKAYAQQNFDIVTTTAGQIAVSTTNKVIDASLKWVDFWYSDEGATMANWGVLGESYVEKNGVKSYIVPQDEVHRWCKGDYGTARFMDVTAALSNYTERQITGTEYWKNTSPDYSLFLPEMINFTTAESKRVAVLMGDIKTYTDETIQKILLGVEDIEVWDNYTAGLEKMGINEVVAIYQDAVNRYMIR